jgi:outer membrane lipoprotein-sorting protein
MKKNMKLVMSVMALAIIALFNKVTAQEQLSAFEIMQLWDNRTVPVDVTSKMTMNLIDKNDKVRTRLIKVYRMSDDKQIMWFLEPADVKGSSFLRLSYDDRDDDMWIYLPAFRKVRRIASHAKKGSFMGSDFTFEDMGDRKLADYTYRPLGEEEIDGKSCWMIESIPAEGVATDYSKIVSWIWKEDYLELKEEFYDRKGNIRKIKTIEAVKVEEYWVPHLIVMEDLKSEHRTEMSLEDIEVDTGLDEDIFNSNYLTRIH